MQTSAICVGGSVVYSGRFIFFDAGDRVLGFPLLHLPPLAGALGAPSSSSPFCGGLVAEGSLFKLGRFFCARSFLMLVMRCLPIPPLPPLPPLHLFPLLLVRVFSFYSSPSSFLNVSLC